MINKETGLVWSRVNSEVAIPVLDFEDMTSYNNFETTYSLEKFNILDQGVRDANVIHTRLIPMRLKNKHRKFWGMKPLKKKKAVAI
jgi:hypothetical protein